MNVSNLYGFCAPISSPMKNIGAPAESSDRPKATRDRVPPGMILRDQHRRGLDQSKRAAPFAKQFYAELIGAGDLPAIGVPAVVTVKCLREIDPQAIDVRLLDKRRGTAHEEMPHDFL